MNHPNEAPAIRTGAPIRPRVVLVIPAYRESARLPAFGAKLLERLADFGGAVELRVVDDGSGMEEVGRIASVIDHWRTRQAWVRPLLALQENGGKGAAVYAGWDAAEGETPEAGWLGFCDADGSVDADETARLIRMLETLPADVSALIASRRAGGVKCEGRTTARSMAARAFSIWVRCWTRLKIGDTQCGCKFVRMADYRRVRSGLTLSRFAFDVELLAAVSERGGRIVEEGVEWRHADGGSLRLLRDGPGMLVKVASLAFKPGTRN